MKNIFLIAITNFMLISTANALTYPGDCKNKTLKKAAKKNDCSLVSGGDHYGVYKNGNRVTTIPFSVKENETCRSIIKALNKECL